MITRQDLIDLLLGVAIPRLEITHHISQDGFQFFALRGNLLQTAIRAGEIGDHLAVVAIHIHPISHGDQVLVREKQARLLQGRFFELEDTVISFSTRRNKPHLRQPGKREYWKKYEVKKEAYNVQTQF